MADQLPSFCSCIRPSQCWGGLDDYLRCRIEANLLPKEEQDTLFDWAKRAYKQGSEDED